MHLRLSRMALLLACACSSPSAGAAASCPDCINLPYSGGADAPSVVHATLTCGALPDDAFLEFDLSDAQGRDDVLGSATIDVYASRDGKTLFSSQHIDISFTTNRGAAHIKPPPQALCTSTEWPIQISLTDKEGHVTIAKTLVPVVQAGDAGTPTSEGGAPAHCDDCVNVPFSGGSDAPMVSRASLTCGALPNDAFLEFDFTDAQGRDDVLGEANIDVYATAQGTAISSSQHINISFTTDTGAAHITPPPASLCSSSEWPVKISLTDKEGHTTSAKLLVPIAKAGQ